MCYHQVLSLLLLVLFIIDSVVSRPLAMEDLQARMTRFLEENYDNVVYLWEMANEYYEAFDEYDSVECLH